MISQKPSTPLTFTVRNDIAIKKTQPKITTINASNISKQHQKESNPQSNNHRTSSKTRIHERIQYNDRDERGPKRNNKRSRDQQDYTSDEERDDSSRRRSGNKSNQYKKGDRNGGRGRGDLVENMTITTRQDSWLRDDRYENSQYLPESRTPLLPVQPSILYPNVNVPWGSTAAHPMGRQPGYVDLFLSDNRLNADPNHLNQASSALPINQQ